MDVEDKMIHVVGALIAVFFVEVVIQMSGLIDIPAYILFAPLVMSVFGLLVAGIISAIRKS